MNRFSILGLASVLIAIGGCAGQSTTGNYAGFDPSLNRTGGTMNASGNGAATVPNAAVWPLQDGQPAIVRAALLSNLAISLDKEKALSAEAVDTAMKGAVDAGFDVVRLSPFHNLNGLKVGKDGIVGGVEPEAMKQLDLFLEKARSHNLKLHIALTNGFGEFEKNPVLDKKAQDAYLKNVIGPIVRKLKANEAVFAIDLHNNWSVEVAKSDKAATWDQVRTFTKTAFEHIKRQDPERLTSAGPVSIDALKQGKLANLGLDFYGVGNAGDITDFPTTKELNLDRPILATVEIPKTAEGDTGPNLLKGQIRSALAGGYSGFTINISIPKEGPMADAVKSSIAETRK